MIVNQLKNKSFRTTAAYVLEKERASILDTNMLGATPRQMSREVAACRRYRPNLQKATLHVIFSLPYQTDAQGNVTHQEDLENSQAVELVSKWREAMQVTNCLYFLARHSDKTHNHFHLVACRIRKDGSVIDDSWDYRRSEIIVRQLEQEFGLEPAPCSNERVAARVEQELGIEASQSLRRAQTQRQTHHGSGKPTVKQRLVGLIDEACQDKPTVTQLIGRLQHQGVTVHPTFSTRGLFREAIAFELDGVKIPGNKLGSAYSFPGLKKKRGVDYNPERDLPGIKAVAAGELVSLEVGNQQHSLCDRSLEFAPILDRLLLSHNSNIVKGRNFTAKRLPSDMISLVRNTDDGEIMRVQRTQEGWKPLPSSGTMSDSDVEALQKLKDLSYRKINQAQKSKLQFELDS